MIGLFWNIRGLGQIGRILALVNNIRSNHVDFVGVIETKKKDFSTGLLRSLTGNISFSWNFLPTNGSAGGILVGVNSESFNVTMGDKLKFSISLMIQDKKSSFDWRLVVVYGSPEEGKQEFIEELHKVMHSWKGPTLLGGDFNLIRVSCDKNNGNINYRWADAFNEWIDKWGLIELNPNNRKYIWTNNQENLVMTKLDRIFATSDWEANYPLTRVKALARLPSDHNPLLIDSGNSLNRPKMRFRFEKWWLEK